MIEKYLKEFGKDGRVVFSVKVKTGASKTEIVEEMADGVFKFNVKAVPEKGKANQEIIKYFSKIFKTKKENIKIIGKKSKLKQISIKK